MEIRTHAQPSPRSLGRVALFRNLPEDGLLHIAACLTFRYARRGTQIYHAGDPSSGLSIIETGQVRLDEEQAGAARASGETLGPGVALGVLSLLTGQPHTTTATVTLDAELWMLAKPDFEALLDRYPAIAVNLARLLATQIQLAERGRNHGMPVDIKCLIGLVSTLDEALLLAGRAVHYSGHQILLLDVIDSGDENSTVDPGDPFADIVATTAGVDRLGVPVELSSGDFSEVVSHLLRKYDQLLIRLPDEDSTYARYALELCEAVILVGPRPDHWVPSTAAPALVWRLADGPRSGHDRARRERERDRLARRLVGRRVGVALSSGGAHGLAHIGLLRVLEQEGIPVDMVAGTSMGAIIGGAFAAGRRGEDLIQVGREAGAFLTTSTAWRFVDLRPSRSGLIRGDRARQYITRWVMNKRFEDLEIPFFAVATEVVSGQAVVFSQGPVSRAIRASTSVPGIMQPVPYGDDYLMDGAAADPVPCRPLAAAGADIIIACNAIPQVADRLYRRMNQRRGGPPNMLELSHSEAEIMAGQIAVLKMKPYDVLIQPKVGQYHWRDGRRITEFVRLGEAATRAALPQIRDLLQPGARRGRGEYRP
jgi:NTE family protein